MKTILIILLSVFLAACSTVGVVPSADAGMINLSWVAPSTNEDGTPLTDLAGFKLYCGKTAGTYDIFKLDVGNVLTYKIIPVEDGTYYCVATAYNKAKMESAYSNEVDKIVINHPSKVIKLIDPDAKPKETVIPN